MRESRECLQGVAVMEEKLLGIFAQQVSTTVR
jgi:hypothetical protein